MPRRKPSDAEIALANANRLLLVFCWCRCAEVSVRADVVRSGMTGSCGRRMCDALNYTALVASAAPCDCKERA